MMVTCLGEKSLIKENPTETVILIWSNKSNRLIQTRACLLNHSPLMFSNPLLFPIHPDFSTQASSGTCKVRGTKENSVDVGLMPQKMDKCAFVLLVHFLRVNKNLKAAHCQMWSFKTSLLLRMYKSIQESSKWATNACTRTTELCQQLEYNVQQNKCCSFFGTNSALLCVRDSYMTSGTIRLHRSVFSFSYSLIRVHPSNIWHQLKKQASV